MNCLCISVNEDEGISFFFNVETKDLYYVERIYDLGIELDDSDEDFLEITDEIFKLMKV